MKYAKIDSQYSNKSYAMKKLIVISSELQSFVYFVDCELRRMKDV